MVYPFVHFPPMLVRESRSMFGSCAEPLATDRHVSWFAKGRSPFTHRTPLWSQTHRGLKTNMGSRAEKGVTSKRREWRGSRSRVRERYEWPPRRLQVLQRARSDQYQARTAPQASGKMCRQADLPMLMAQ